MKKHILFYSLIAIIFASCSKDNNETNILEKPKEGTEEPLKPSPNSVKSVNGGFYKPNVGGPNQPNQVFIDLSTGEQTAVKRDSWDFAFLCDPKDHRVILNNTIKMAAKKLETTNIDEVQDIDESVVVGPSTAQTLGYVDSPYGAFVNSPTGTAIKKISEKNDENKVYLVNMGYDVGVKTPEIGAISLDEGIHRGWKKVRVIRNGDDYVIQYANLRDKTHKTMTIKKKTTHNFVYINLEKGTEVEVQPDKTKWDISFTAMTLYRNIPQTVTYFFGDVVIHNLRGVKVKKIVTNSQTRDREYEAFNKLSADNGSNEYFKESKHQLIIGTTWRNTQGGAQLLDNVFYIIRDGDGNLYKLKFASMVNHKGERGYPVLQSDVLK